MSSLNALASVTSSDGPPMVMHCVRVEVWPQAMSRHTQTRRMVCASYYEIQFQVGSVVSGQKQLVLTWPGAIGPGVGTGHAGECGKAQQLQLVSGPLLSQYTSSP